MTTASFSTRVRHDSDATFREWGLEFATQLAAVGLVQTADTGQINWGSVTRPGSNTNAGYEIWRMNDSLQGTAPVFFRIDYGTSGTTTAPAITFTAGTGSNGTGTITGTALTAARRINGNTSQVTDTARQSYFCVTEGFVGINWKTATTSTEGLFLFCRTVDTAGAISVTGGLVVWGAGTSSQLTATQALRYAATAAAYTAQVSVANTALGLSPQAPLATSVGVDIQAFLAWTITPRVAPLVGICGVLNGEVSAGSTFTTTLVGTTSRTYIGLTNVAGPHSAIDANTVGGTKFAMLWE